MLTAVDTNVISALWSKEPASSGVERLLFDARQRGGLVISAPVYCELLAYPGASKSFVASFLDDTSVQVHYMLGETVWQAAGEAFSTYAQRRRKDGAGHPKRLLVDFVVGAHALNVADRLLTLDVNRYMTSFPSLKMVEHES